MSKSERPWNQGGKEDCLDRAGLTMTHDELQARLGQCYDNVVRTIEDAGFVLVPRSWRDAAMQEKRHE